MDEHEAIFAGLQGHELEPGMLLIPNPVVTRESPLARLVLFVAGITDEHAELVVLNRLTEEAVGNVAPLWAPLALPPRVVYRGLPAGVFFESAPRPHGSGGGIEQFGLVLGVLKDAADVSQLPRELRHLGARIVEVFPAASVELCEEWLIGVRCFESKFAWSLDDLAEHIAEDVLYVAPALPADLLSRQASDVWAGVFRRLPAPVSLFATYPASLSEN